MQESTQQWDPIIIDHVMSWEIRLFVFYLLFVMVFFLVRVTQLSWFLWTSRRQAGSLDSGGETIMRDLVRASIRIVSLKRGSVLTLLLAILTSSVRGAEVFRSMSIERFFGSAAAAAAGSELLSVFALGTGVSAAMYAVFAIFDGRLLRLRLQLENRR